LLKELFRGLLEWENPDFFGFEFEPLLALGANAAVTLNYFVGRFEFKSMIEN